jgi:glycosyltransferase involved in cell wall biosynthesis
MRCALRSSSSTCADGLEPAHYDGCANNRGSVASKLLKGLVPVPLRQPMRRGVLFLVPPLRRRLTRTWRRRNRLKRRVGRVRKRLNRLRRKQLRALKDVWLNTWLSMWYVRRGNPPVRSSNQIHLVNPLQDYTGSPQRTLHLFDALKDHTEVCLWSEHKVPPEIARKYPVKRIAAWRFRFPKAGTLVIVGSLSIGPWIHYTRPRRTIFVQNSTYMTPGRFRQRLRYISNGGRREVEVAYASELTKRMAGNHPGYVQASLIDLDRFVPAPSKKEPSGSSSGAFTVGRLSRADPLKHHPEDAALYRRLVEEGCRVRIMGPSPSLEAELGGLESVTLLPMFAEEAHLFLQGLDCFFYRTSEEFVEPSGRVITEAMACGLPVVCHESGGYAEWIEHGHNGFLFESQQEAMEILLGLKEDRALRERVGREARRTAEELFSDVVRSEIVEFYLR